VVIPQVGLESSFEYFIGLKDKIIKITPQSMKELQIIMFNYLQNYKSSCLTTYRIVYKAICDRLINSIIQNYYAFSKNLNIEVRNNSEASNVNIVKH